MWLRISGARGRIRTTDTRIFSPLLYQLSYPGNMRHDYVSHRILHAKQSQLDLASRLAQTDIPAWPAAVQPEFNHKSLVVGPAHD